MATQIANLQAVISADVSGLKSGLKDAQDSTKSFGSNLKDIGKQAAAFGLAQIGVSSFSDVMGMAKDKLTDWFQGAEQAQVAQSQLNSILQSGQHVAGLTSDSVSKLVQSLADQSNIDDDAVQSAANVFAAYSGLSKDAFPGATQAALQMARAYQMAHGGAVDAQGAATALEQAMMKPQRAMLTLRQYGVDLTQQDQDQINTWQKKGDSAKVQAFLMQKVNDATKGAVSSYDSTAQGKVEAFNTKVDNLGKQLMSNLLPALSKAADIGTDVISFFQKGGPQAQIIAGIIGGVLVVAVGAYAVSMASAAVATIAATWPILAIVAAVGLLVAGFLWAYNNIGPFRGIVQWIATFFAGQFHNAILGAQLILGKIGDFIGGPLATAWNGFKLGIQTLVTTVGNFIGKLGDLLGVLGHVKDAVGGALGGAGNLLSHIPGFAGGTSDAPGGFAMVGESGPELMYVPTHARIYPNGTGPSVAGSQSGGGTSSGGRGISIGAVHVYGDDADSTARAVVAELNWQQMLNW